MNWIGKAWSSVFGPRGFSNNLFGHSFSLLDTSTSFFDYGDDTAKINAVFSSPALLKVFALQCDLFSLGKISVQTDKKITGEDPLLNMLNNPNPFQTGQQILWDYQFWHMIGNAYMYVDSAEPTKENNFLYFLATDKLRWPDYFNKNKDKLFLSDTNLKELYKQIIPYRYSDGSTMDVPYNKMLIFNDLTNGTGNWFKGNSRIDALYKVISNSEASLDSKNINIRYAGKFMVAGKNDPGDVDKMPMGKEEKSDIENKVDGPKIVHAVKSMIDIKRFVENIAALKLDESYLADYYLIGSMFNIPREVLEAYNQKGATFENQEKSMIRHINYTLQPKGDAFMNGLNKKFGYNNGKKLIISWEHLPCMQAVAKDRADVKKIKAETLVLLQKAGASLEEINKFLDTEFTSLNPQENGTEEKQTE